MDGLTKEFAMDKGEPHCGMPIPLHGFVGMWLIVHSAGMMIPAVFYLTKLGNRMVVGMMVPIPFIPASRTCHKCIMRNFLIENCLSGFSLSFYASVTCFGIQ